MNRTLALILALSAALTGCGGGAATETQDAGPCAGYEVTWLDAADPEDVLYATRPEQKNVFEIKPQGVLITSASNGEFAPALACAQSQVNGRPFYFAPKPDVRVWRPIPRAKAL